MSDEWEVITDISTCVMTSGANHCLGVHEGYEYKVMRRMIKTEREQFIESSHELCSGAGSAYAFGLLYDGGARFK
jgi:hypothetical protein